MSHDMPVAPDARLGDGVMYLIMIRKGISKLQMTQLFLDMEHGQHVRHKEVLEIHCVQAFRLEPLSPSEGPEGRVSVDGEEVANGPIQQHIWPRAGSVMCLGRKEGLGGREA
ncbi:unnamed protein product [Discosporangium mesarthrocarpum]